MKFFSPPQPKNLRKMIQHMFKEYSLLSEEECVFKFFETLSKVWRFDQETFKCALGVSVAGSQFICDDHFLLC